MDNNSNLDRPFLLLQTINWMVRLMENPAQQEPFKQGIPDNLKNGSIITIAHLAAKAANFKVYLEITEAGSKMTHDEWLRYGSAWQQMLLTLGVELGQMRIVGSLTDTLTPEDIKWWINALQNRYVILDKHWPDL